MYKESHYNHMYVNKKNNVSLIYNAYTGALARLRNPDEDVIQGLLHNPNDQEIKVKHPEIFKNMLGCGFIVESDIDELALIRVRHLKGVFKQEEFLSFTIVPTFKCNLKCIYCFEDGRNEYMTKNDVDEILQYMRLRIKEFDVKKIYIGWYGGEPLLCMKIIEYLSSAVRNLCYEHNLEYEGTIITNGLLLNSSIAKRLKENAIVNVQITLDGPEEIHNKRRILKNGGPSFQSIRNAIIIAKHFFKEITIRINVDKKNIDSLDILLNEPWLYNDNVKIGAGYLKDFSDLCSLWNPNDLALSGDEYYRLQKRFEEMLGINTKNTNRDGAINIPVKSRICGADHIDGYAFGPGRSVYKCISALNVCNAVGTLREGKIHPNKNFADWLLDDPTQSSLCKECSILPLCMGGCPNYRKRPEDHISQTICSYWRAFLADHLEDISKNFKEL